MKGPQYSHLTLIIILRRLRRLRKMMFPIFSIFPIFSGESSENIDGKIPPRGSRLRAGSIPGILAGFSPGMLRRLRAIMSTRNRRNYMINQQLPQTGFLLFLGKNYLPQNRDSVPLCLIKTGVYPIYMPFLRFLSHFEKGRLRTPSAILGGLHG
jgi:hypothetical protein